MKKVTVFAVSLLGLIIMMGNFAFAATTLDYGNGLKFTFENIVLINNRDYQIDNIEYKSEQLTNGQYYANEIIAVLGSNDIMSHYSDDIDPVITSKIKNVSTGAYLPGDLIVEESISPQSDTKTGPNRKIAIIKSRSEGIDPGKYIIETNVRGRSVTSFQVCLPSFTSTIGKIIGNETCGGNNIINANNAGGTGETTLPAADQKNALTVTVTPPSGDAIVFLGDNDNKGPYSAQFKGTFATTLNMRVGLDLYIGESAESMFRVSPAMFPQELIMANSVKTIDFTQYKLDPGTTYFYKIREKTKGFDATQVGQFTTPGTKPAGTQPFDPNAASGFIDYEYPTQLGEPDGAVTVPTDDVPTLVPCGKLSDRNTSDARCNFGHLGILVGNVIRFMLAMLIPLTALACVYTGVQMIIHRTMPDELVKYKARLLKIGGGLAIMLLAWTIVATVMNGILGADASKYLLLKIF